MKKIIISMSLAAISFAIANNAAAQKDSSGIYKTASDYQQSRLSYAINYKTENHQIKDNILFNEDKIVVKHEGHTFNLDKNSTYGYKSTKGDIFRFVDKKEYKVLNPGQSPVLYVYQYPNSTKGTVKYVAEYYFSADPSANVQALTKENLKAAYPENHKFHDALDATFKTDEGLASFDSFHKMYKINHLLEMSKTN
jgi:hypothetical protein